MKAIAKERGIRGYYKLRKAELLHVLEAARLVEQTSNIFDESIPHSSFTTITMEVIKYHDENKQNITNFITKGMQNIKDLDEWLLNYIPPKPKVVDKVLEPIKNKI